MNDKGTKENATNVPADKIIATVDLQLLEQCPQERWDLSDEQASVILDGTWDLCLSLQARCFILTRSNYFKYA